MDPNENDPGVKLVLLRCVKPSNSTLMFKWISEGDQLKSNLPCNFPRRTSWGSFPMFLLLRGLVEGRRDDT